MKRGKTYKKNSRLARVKRQYKKRAFLDFFYIFVISLIAYGTFNAAKPMTVSVYKDFTNAKEHIKVYAQSSITPTSTLTPTPTLTPKYTWEDFKTRAVKIARIYNYPLKVLLSQAAVESKRGMSSYAIERNNFFGLNAVDWNPDLAWWYENPEQCMIDYITTIRENFPEAWALRDKPEEMIKKLKVNSQGNMYATDPDYVAKLMNTPEWREY